MTHEQRIDFLQRYLARLDRRIKHLERVSNRYANLRVIVFIVLVIFIVDGLTADDLLLVGMRILASLGVFIMIALLHRRVEQTIRRIRIWRAIKREHLARAQLDWDHIPENDEPEDLHPLEIDLDLLDLHQLLDTSSTRQGSERLRDWLLTLQPEQDVVDKRQLLVRELAPLTNFRDRLTLLSRMAADGAKQTYDGRSLLSWLERQPPLENMQPTLIGLMILSGLTAAAFILFYFDFIPPVWVIPWVAYIALYFVQSRRMGDIFSDATHIADALHKFGLVMRYLEGNEYRHLPHLRQLLFPIVRYKPSEQLRRISWVAGAASLRANPVLWLPINAVFPWDLFFAVRLENEKQALREHLPQWLDCWFALEAVHALANFAYLHPTYTFPEFDGNDDVLRAAHMGHPLIPHETRINNDFYINHLGEVVIITGSNMSGKSSFLRTVGVNLCLAYAGGVVDAIHFRSQLLRVFTSIRVSDSLEDGISYFYAEVRRLKQLLDEVQRTDDTPVLFLIDEIFRGTNNRERYIGSRAYVRALIDGNGTGLISTHDLELVQLADTYKNVRNVHFREFIDDGLMQFDYQLHDGPSPTTNALIIMAMEGLPVDMPEEVS